MLLSFLSCQKLSPNDVTSWCQDDKNSFYIEKSVAEIVFNSRVLSSEDSHIGQIEEELKKEPSNGIPQYVLLLDGLNEVSSLPSKYGLSPRSLLENEIAKAIPRYKNARIIITSRNDTACIKKVKRIHVLGINTETVVHYLSTLEDKKLIRSGVKDRVSKSEDLLECLRIPLFLNMFAVISDNPQITTRGEILRDFFHVKRQTLYSKQIEGLRINEMILDFLVPEIAWKMSINDCFDVSRNEVAEILTHVFTSATDSVILNQFLSECFELPREQLPLISETKDKVIANAEKETDNILNIVLDDLSILYSVNGRMCFKHHHFRDYFAAVHIINQIRLCVYLFENGCNSTDEYSQDLRSVQLNQVILRFISESLDVHYTNPVYQAGKWSLRQPGKNLIFRMINLYRDVFDDTGWALWNLVQMINLSGMGLLGVDLSDLNLKNVEFNGILCGIDSNQPELATNFEGSLVRLQSFLPISHNEIVNRVHYSPEGGNILTVSNKAVIVWDAKYSFVRKWMIEHDSFIDAFFSDDAHYVVCHLSNNSLIIYDVWTGREHTILGHDHLSKITAVCAGDTQSVIFVAYENHKIKRFNFKQQKFQGPSIRCRTSIAQLYYDSKNRMLVVHDKFGIVWKYAIATNQSFTPFYQECLDFAVSNSGKCFALISHDGTVHLSGNYCQFEQQYCEEPAIHVFLSPDGSHIGMVSRSNTLYIYDRQNKIYKRPLKCSQGITSVIFSNDNKYVITCAGDYFARIWEIKSNVGICIKPLGDIADWIRNAYYSPSGKQAISASIDGTAKMWNLHNRKLEQIYYGHTDRVTSASFNHSGELIVTTSDDCSAKVWNINNCGCEVTLRGNNNSVHNAAFSPDGSKLATVSWDNTGSIWDLSKQVECCKLIGHTEPILTVQYDPTGDYLITSSNDNTALLWNSRSGKLIGKRAQHNTRLNSAAFSPDGIRIITSAFDNTACVWNADRDLDGDSIDLISILDGHTDSVRGASFSPDGRYIVTVSRDTTGRLWDGEDYHCIQKLVGHTFFVRSSMFDQKSQKVITASYDGTIREWNLNGENTNLIASVPGVFVCGCDFSRLLNSDTNEESSATLDILNTHGAIVPKPKGE